MNLNDLLRGEGIDLESVLVLRHRPSEPKLNKVLPWLVAERPAIFNAYQQAFRTTAERAMATTRYLASFLRHQAGRALFAGLYEITDRKSITREEYWTIPENIELQRFGMHGFADEDARTNCLWLTLAAVDFYPEWKGKLIVRWPPPERSWFRRAHKNDIAIDAILEDSALDAEMPGWDEFDLSWEELRVLPSRWKNALRQWRGIYYIFDSSDGKGYVGAAYGEGNILSRWENYAADGHGGNMLLLNRDPRNFQFTILQRVSPDMEPNDVIQVEVSWKNRLHTRAPFGLNEN